MSNINQMSRFEGPNEVVLPPPRPLSESEIRHTIRTDLAYVASHGGLLPSDDVTQYLDYRYNLAVETGHERRFEFYHGARATEMLAVNAALTRPMCEVTGILPQSADVAYLELRYQEHPSRFTLNHPIITPYLVADIASRESMSCPPPSCPTVPEPSSVVMFVLAIMTVLTIKIFRTKTL